MLDCIGRKKKCPPFESAIDLGRPFAIGGYEASAVLYIPNGGGMGYEVRQKLTYRRRKRKSLRRTVFRARPYFAKGDPAAVPKWVAKPPRSTFLSAAPAPRMLLYFAVIQKVGGAHLKTGRGGKTFISGSALKRRTKPPRSAFLSGAPEPECSYIPQ